MSKQTLIERRHVKAIKDLERAEARMVAAFARWSALRSKVRRYDAAADKRAASEYDQFESLAQGKLVRGG